MTEVLLDAAGRRRSPATMPEFHAGRPPRNKGHRYPADPPTVEEIVAVMRAAGDARHRWRLRGLIVVLWRAGLRIHEALALNESDLEPRRGALLVRRGKGGRRREVGMDDWAWEPLQPWIDTRAELPVGPLFCVINGPRADGHGSTAAARADPRRVAATAGVRRSFAPHQLRHAHAVEMAQRRRPAHRHPAPARPQQPRHHLHLPPKHRQLRDHRGRPRPPGADGRGQRLAPALTLAATLLVAQSRSAPGRAPSLAPGPRADTTASAGPSSVVGRREGGHV
jgi:integrase